MRQRLPGRVIARETVTFTRKLDQKEIDGYNAAAGLESLKPEALAAIRGTKLSKQRQRGD